MKFQTPTIGGIRKVIRTQDNSATLTTIAETLVQLAAIVNRLQNPPNTGGGNIGTGNEASISLGPGLSGGGTLVGSVPINLTAPIPWGLEDSGGGDGDIGPPGVPGANGATGAQGPLGPAIFLAAEDGADGDVGPQGAPGSTGATGATGSTGIPGPPGAILVFANTTVPAGNTVANTSIETFFTSSYSIPAGTMTAGMVFRVKLFGTYSTGIVAPSLTLRIYFGATILVSSGAVTTVANITNDGWSAEGIFTVQTLGSLGSVEAQGLSEFSTAATTALVVNMDNTAAIAINTTISQTVQVSAQWGGTVNASDTITLREMTVEALSIAGISIPSPPPPFPFFLGDDGEEGAIGAPGIQGAQGIAGTGTAVAVPGTIPSLLYWWDGGGILASSGETIYRIKESTPWVTGVMAANSTSTIKVNTTPLNGLNTLKWPALAAGGVLNIAYPVAIDSGATFFSVFNPSTVNNSGGQQAIIGGPGGCLSFNISSANGGTAITLVKSGLAIIGVSNTSWVAGTAVQANATYNSITGAFAFRQSRAAAGSGTGATAAGVVPFQWIGADFNASSGLLNTASIGELIVYNRVLTSGEITSVETYLNTKWGV